MPDGLARTARYLRSWLTRRAEVEAEEISLDRGDRSVPATFLRPAARTRGLRAWIVLHGVTRPGRAHEQLVRFTRSLASTGTAVLIPEVPEWRELDLAPAVTTPTVRAALAALRARPEVAEGAPGLVGFSFGAPQAIAASGAPELRGQLAGVVAFGGYCDLERTVVFQVTGRHEWEGQTLVDRPDPYGRWIVAANYLLHVEGYRGCEDAVHALRTLAADAGDRGVYAGDPELDVLKRRLRGALSGESLEVFDLLAPDADVDPDPEQGEALAHELAAAARKVTPAIEPAPRFADVPGPVHLLHGRSDHLIPFSEAPRLAAALPDGALHRLTITRLFAHSKGDPFPWSKGIKETTAFVRALGEMLSLV